MAGRLIVALLLLAVSTACATGRVVRLDTGQGEPLEFQPPSSSKPVKVRAHEFEGALTELVVSAPLRLQPPSQGGLVRASYPSAEEQTRWKRLMSKSYGGLCAEGQRRDNCLSLLDDVAGLSETDKLGVTLGLSLEPMKESIARAVEDTLAPQLFYTVIATGLVSWAVLAANPEPVFTKAAAVVSALLLLYLGVETFLELVEASRELKRASDRATRPRELEVAGRRFANRVGPELARVFVLATTVVVSYGLSGGSAWLATRLPRLPEAVALGGGAQASLALAQVGEVRQVAVVGNAVVISLPSTAIAMSAMGPGGGPAASSAGGQLHHPISKRIARELEEHPSLAGHYTARDPRFVTRAADKNSHNGYQQWHRDVEDEIIAWVKKYDDITPAQFEAYLREVYNRPAMRARFPDGF